MVVKRWRDQVRLAGPFQQLVMLAVIRLGRDTHAPRIKWQIQRTTGRIISLTAVYTTLDRLAKRGYAYTWKRKPFGNPRVADYLDRDRRGPRGTPRCIRRFFQVTTLGRHVLRLTLRAADRMQPGLPGFGREHELYSFLAAPNPFPQARAFFRRHRFRRRALRRRERERVAAERERQRVRPG